MFTDSVGDRQRKRERERARESEREQEGERGDVLDTRDWRNKLSEKPLTGFFFVCPSS